MRMAEMLAVGTELLMGQISNTNAQYISRRLPDAGVGVYYHSVVGDNPGRLKESLKLALSRADIVIMTGGLGPTCDDLTKETVAEMMNRKLVLHEESLQKIEAFFSQFGRKMTENNKKQAYLPENSIIIKNSNGTAPGCIIEEGDKVVVMLPGPPSEMRPMFEETVFPYFLSRSSQKLVSKYIRIFGIGESAVEDMLMDLVTAQSNPTIAPYAKEGEVTLRITARYDSDNEQDVIEPVIAEIKKRLGLNVYSTENKDIEEVAAELLMKSGLSISTAESCTGGMVSQRLTAIPGISSVFTGGIIAYGNSVKTGTLGVKPETLEKHGAVSSETAVEMAEGIRRLLKTDIGVSVTGIAGPSGGTAEKPVGLVYVGLAGKDGTTFKELNLWGGRERIRHVTCLHAFDMIRRYIINN